MHTAHRAFTFRARVRAHLHDVCIRRGLLPLDEAAIMRRVDAAFALLTDGEQAIINRVPDEDVVEYVRPLVAARLEAIGEVVPTEARETVEAE